MTTPDFAAFPELFNPAPYLKSPSDVKMAIENWYHTTEAELALSLPWILYWIVTEPDRCDLDEFEISRLIDKVNIDSIDGQYSLNRIKLHSIDKINAKKTLEIYSRLNAPQLSMLRDLVSALKQRVGIYEQDEIDEVVFVIDLLVEKRIAQSNS